jgi:hypothetical protein
MRPSTLPSGLQTPALVEVGELGEQPLVGVPAALAVLHGDDELLSRLAARGEGRLRPLDADAYVPAHERERRVPAQHARQQAGLAEDLEAVADAEHGAAAGGEVRDRRHRGGEARDGAAAEVVAVREAARQDDAVHVGELCIRMPHGNRVGTHGSERPERVAVVVRAGEDDDGDARTELHQWHPASVIS